MYGRNAVQIAAAFATERDVLLPLILVTLEILMGVFSAGMHPLLSIPSYLKVKRCQWGVNISPSRLSPSMRFDLKAKYTRILQAEDGALPNVPSAAAKRRPRAGRGRVPPIAARALSRPRTAKRARTPGGRGPASFELRMERRTGLDYSGYII